MDNWIWILGQWILGHWLTHLDTYRSSVIGQRRPLVMRSVGCSGPTCTCQGPPED